MEHVLRYVMDFRSAMLCIKIRYRIYNVLKWNIRVVRFQCDSKRKKTNFFLVFV